MRRVTKTRGRDMERDGGCIAYTLNNLYRHSNKDTGELGLSPAEMLTGRKLRNNLPELKKNVET